MSSQSIKLFAAGSLKESMTELIHAFQAVNSDIEVSPTFGATGGLREKVENGESCDVFASADMRHPQILQEAGLAGSVKKFAGNRMVALVRPGLSACTDDIESLLEDPNIRIGISAPGNTPNGDYAVEILSRIHAP